MTNPTKEAVPSQDLTRRFGELATQWKRERGPHSSSARLAEHPAYQAIIALGPAVVPLLLRELEREPDHWFRALHALTGANPVPEASRANGRTRAQAWITGGRNAACRRHGQAISPADTTS